ncbi:EamA family transporter [Rhodobacterales bacterium 52_120_T64]|nr:EamA family transporter [Rhodobacterales bacterium 52_120_T64]
MTRNRSTLIGFGAVLLWALLATLTVGASEVPAFQLSAMCFALGGTIGLLWIAFGGSGFEVLRGINWKIWVLGIGGLFGYHFFYFTALKLAPPAEAGLIAYLWPLLIVLFSGLLPGESLKPLHVIGALVAFGGAALIVGGGATAFSSDNLAGYGAAIVCAFTWSGYSVLSRLAGATPTESVAVFCLAASGLSLLAHLGLEETVWPTGVVGWGSVIGLGLGPVGLAFYIWDIGVKKGDIQILGVASYAAPMLSTVILILVGYATASWTLLLAAALITTGAAIAALANR